jgi:hypothetical protein
VAKSCEYISINTGKYLTTDGLSASLLRRVREEYVLQCKHHHAPFYIMTRNMFTSVSIEVCPSCFVASLCIQRIKQTSGCV